MPGPFSRSTRVDAPGADEPPAEPLSEAVTTEAPAVPADGNGAASPEAPADGATAPGPAAPAPQEAAPAEAPSFRHRARLRRRARYLRRLREVQLRDLGGLVLELDRAGRDRGDLVRQKLDGLRATAAELNELEAILGAPATLLEVREPGVGGSCPRCRAIHGSADRFCAACGQELRA